jgi:hypothetical protein
VIPWFAWTVGVIAVEDITEIILHGYPLESLRRLAKKTTFFGLLIECGFCTSLWVAIPVCAVILSGWWVILMPLVLHRLSGAFHYGMNILREKRWEKNNAVGN